MSEYAIGPHAWLMTTAFVALGSGLLALGQSLRARESPNRMSRIVPASAAIAGVGMLTSGIFRVGDRGPSEFIHNRASAVGAIAVVFMALVVWRIGRSSRPRGASALGARLAFVALILALLSPLLHETRWTGLSQRLLWATLLSWLVWATWHSPSLRDMISARMRS